jgi:hypothetical protein
MNNTDERAQRLAAQLRANLHRRKAQARAAARPVETVAPAAEAVPGTDRSID